MKTKEIITAILIMVILYLAGAFIQADFNFNHWSMDSRGVLVLAMFFVNLLYFTFFYEK